MPESTQATDSMSAAETAYFNSGGEKTDGLDAPETTTETKTAVDTKAPADTSDRTRADSALPDADDGDEKPDIGEDGKPKNKGQWVRYGALHAEREEKKTLKAALDKANEDRARFDERFRILQEAMQPEQTAATEDDPEPDPEVDFIAHQKWIARQVRAEKEARLSGEQKTKALTEQQQAENSVIAAANADAVAFAKETPDFGDAYMHLLNSRAAMYQSMGYSNQEIHAQMRADEIAVYSRAKQRNMSAAELIYNLSKTVGYVKKAATEGEEKPDGADITKEIDKIETINKGQKAAKTLSGSGGSPVQPLTADALISMSQEEFNAVARRHPAEVRRLMGG